MTTLTLTGLAVRRADQTVLHPTDLTVGPGEVVGLIGPNGAGKTTLLRAALGLLPAEGFSSLAALPPPVRARTAAWLPQKREIAWPVTVERLVALGRPPGAQDTGIVERALARMELAPLRDRPATALSGGEQARALIARALAQDTPLLLADEPAAGLDPAAQIAAMEVFAALAGEGRGVIVSLHDLGLAARHCTRLVLLTEGRVMADAPPPAVLTPDLLARSFGIRAYFTDTADGPVFQPLDRLP